jgi:hypothetical protein
LRNTILQMVRLEALETLGQQDKQDRQVAKMGMIQIAMDLMPGGKPAFLDVIKYPTIKKLIEEMGEPSVLLMLSVMVRDFCGSLNVSRNMNEDQILEAAMILLKECGNFRLEDYTMMFAMAKRGELIPNFYERIDVLTITTLLDLYWAKRHDAARQMEAAEEGTAATALGPSLHMADIPNPSEITRRDKDGNDVKLSDYFSGMTATLSQLREGLKDNQERINPNKAQ